MLVLKRISIKKLAIYISILVLMFGATGMILYQNWKLSNRQTVPVNNMIPADQALNVQTPIAGNEITPSQPVVPTPIDNSVPIGQPLNTPAPVSSNEMSPNQSSIDLTIFGSEKFKALQENVLIPQAETSQGKRDPFKPN